MAIIGMIGPHAVGKTLALKRWQARYGDGLETVSLDAVRKAYPGNPEKAALVAHLRADPRVCVIESARGFAGWLSCLRPGEPVIVLTTPEPVVRLWWGERRVARGKSPALGEYWTARRLDYECNSHLTNWIEKLAPGQAKHFVITDRERDWPLVDEYFGSLYRRIHNARLRKG